MITPNPQEEPSSLPALDPADGLAVDAFLAGRRGEPAVPAEPARVARAQAVLSLLDHYPVTDPPLDLVHQTLQRTARMEAGVRTAALRTGIGAPGMRWGELGTIAAVVVIGLSLVIPMLSRASEDARRTACLNNLHETGAALASYAADNNDVLPRGNVHPNGEWWHVGQGPDADGQVQSNSSNLYMLVRDGYLRLKNLACPDNAQATRYLPASATDWPSVDAVSYSYQNQYGSEPTRLGRSRSLAVLADRNPLFTVEAKRGLDYRADMPADSASKLHGGWGQNILIADGGAFWDRQPVLSNGDNIWLVRGLKSYKGNETPEDADDSFLVP